MDTSRFSSGCDAKAHPYKAQRFTNSLMPGSGQPELKELLLRDDVFPPQKPNNAHAVHSWTAICKMSCHTNAILLYPINRDNSNGGKASKSHFADQTPQSGFSPQVALRFPPGSALILGAWEAGGTPALPGKAYISAEGIHRRIARCTATMSLAGYFRRQA